jgi:hypothetical protein
MMKHGKTSIALVIFGAAIACIAFSQSLSSEELSEIPTDSNLNNLAWTMMTGSKSSDLLGDCSGKFEIEIKAVTSTSFLSHLFHVRQGSLVPAYCKTTHYNRDKLLNCAWRLHPRLIYLV